jgi:hypothetical protein
MGCIVLRSRDAHRVMRLAFWYIPRRWWWTIGLGVEVGVGAKSIHEHIDGVGSVLCTVSKKRTGVSTERNVITASLKGRDSIRR